ncbi:MAG: gluconate 2-dehydrogenase subunit 3 family protein [Ginsengibacter sp.]
MNRRTVIRNVVIISAGSAVLPSCLLQDKVTIPLKHVAITGNQEKLVAELSKSIIPKSNFIGAADVKAHEFTLMMVDDCYAPDEQKKFTNGLTQFDQLAQDKLGKSFTNFTAAEKKALLTTIENKENIPEEVLQFYQTTKRHTVQAFTTSKEYMTEVRHYKIVPGSNFIGCVPLVKASQPSPENAE